MGDGVPLQMNRRVMITSRLRWKNRSLSESESEMGV